MKYLIIIIASALVGLGAASAAQSPLHSSTQAAARVSIPSKCWGVTMHVEPGALNPDGSPWKGWQIAKDMPLDPVTAEAPLYPGAVASHAPLAQDILVGVRGSNYIKTAVAEFSLPAGVGPALRWYRKSFTACGFPPNGVTGKGRTTTTEEFVSSTTSGLYVDVSLEAVPSHFSLVLYYASALSHPARPERSFVPDTGVGKTTTITSANVTCTGPPARSACSSP